MVEAIRDSRLPAPSGPYCYAFRVNDYIFLGGTPGITNDPIVIDGVDGGRMAGKTPGRADMKAQTTQALDSLKLAMQIVGGKWEDVMRLNNFVDDWRETAHFVEAFEAGCAPAAPAETLVGYGLYMPSMIMEIEGFASAAPTSALVPSRPRAHVFAPANAGRRMGDLLCLSSVLPLNENGAPVAPGDPVRQTTAIIEEIQDVLTKNGCALDDVIRLRVFVRDVRDVAPAEAAIAAAFSDPKPIVSICIPTLPIVGMSVMIEATAYAGAKEYRDGPGNARAVIISDLLYTNAVASIDANGQVVDPWDIAKQTQNTLANVRGILKEFGMTQADITQSQVTVPEFRNYDAYNEIYRDFVTFPFPARNTVEAKIGSLSQQGLEYQIEVTACRNASSLGVAATSTDNYYFKRMKLDDRR